MAYFLAIIKCEPGVEQMQVYSGVRKNVKGHNYSKLVMSLCGNYFKLQLSLHSSHMETVIWVTISRQV